MKALLLTLALLAGAASAAAPPHSLRSSRDKPHAQASADKLERAMAPYVAQAKASYPEARQRFLNGLPRGESFFVVTSLTDTAGRKERVYIAVQSIDGSRITGQIWNNLHLVEGYRYRDIYSFDEKQLTDWLISKPDGSEEGNAVGKFLDTYQAR